MEADEKVAMITGCHGRLGTSPLVFSCSEDRKEVPGRTRWLRLRFSGLVLVSVRSCESPEFEGSQKQTPFVLSHRIFPTG